MLEDPQLGSALLVVRDLHSYASGTDEIPEPLKQMIARELANYESQIVGIGTARAAQQ